MDEQNTDCINDDTFLCHVCGEYEETHFYMEQVTKAF